MEEIWKPVKNFEGYYEVSSWGRVRSVDRIDCRGQFRKGIIRIATKDQKGYLRLPLCKNGKHETVKVHRLVAEAFLPNPDNLQQVNHKNEIKTDNFVYINDDGSVDLEKSNLEFCNNGYNQNYGTRNQRIGEKLTNGKSSKRVYQYTLDGEFVREWPSANEPYRIFGWLQGPISNCCRGEQKTAYGYIWMYKEKGAA